jgi:hypothetical protein
MQVRIRGKNGVAMDRRRLLASAGALSVCLGLGVAIGAAPAAAQLPTPEEAATRCSGWLTGLRLAPFADAAIRCYGERPADGARGVFVSAEPSIEEDTATCRAEVLVFPGGPVGDDSVAEVWSFEEEIARDPALRSPDDPPILAWSREGERPVDSYVRTDLGACVEAQRGSNLLRVCDVTWTRGNPAGLGDHNVRRGLVVTDMSGFPLGMTEVDAWTFDDEDGPTQMATMTWETVGQSESEVVEVLVTRRLEVTDHVAPEGSCAAAPRHFTYADLLRWDGAEWTRLATLPTRIAVEGEVEGCRASEHGRLDIVVGPESYELVVRDISRDPAERLESRLREEPVTVAAAAGRSERAVPLPFDDAGSQERDPAALQRCEEAVRALLGAAERPASTIEVVRPGERAFAPTQADFAALPLIVEAVGVSRSAIGAWQCHATVRAVFDAGLGVEGDLGEVWITEGETGVLRRALWSSEMTYY